MQRSSFTRPLLLDSYPFREVLPWWRGPRELFHYVVSNDNIGNTVYLDALLAQVEGIVPVAEWQLTDNPHAIGRLGDVVLLPLSNMLSPSFQAPVLVDALESSGVPVVLVSVGLQAEAHQDPLSLELSRDARRLLELAARHGTTVGVRGQTSLTLVRQHGYTHARVIGCPSVVDLSGFPTLPEKPQNVALHGTLHEAYTSQLRALFDFGSRNDCGWIMQSERRMLAELLDVQVSDVSQERLEVDPEMSIVLQTRDADMRHYFPHDRYHAAVLWFRRRAFFPETRLAWLQHLRSYDLVFGTRLHGSVCGLRAGVPSVLVTTDHRTMEIAEHHGLPRVDFRALPPIGDWPLHRLVEWIQAHVSPPPSRDLYEANLAAYSQFLLENGLSRSR